MNQFRQKIDEAPRINLGLKLGGEMQLPVAGFLFVRGVTFLIVGMLKRGIQPKDFTPPNFFRSGRGIVGLSLMAIWLWGCTTPALSPTPPVKADCRIKINGLITDRDLIQPKQSMIITADVENPEGHALVFNWQANYGQMTPGLRTDSSVSTYTAPLNLVNDTISVSVIALGCTSVTLSKQIGIISSDLPPSRTPAPFSEASFTSSETPSPVPSETPSATPSETPSATPTRPPQLAMDFSQLAKELKSGYPLWSLAWSPDGKLLASGDGNHVLRIWNTTTWELQLTLPEFPAGTSVANIVWSRDSRWLMWGSGDGSIKLWDTNSNQPPRLQEKGHSVAISGLAWSPDGSRFASSSKKDGMVFIWDPTQITPLYVLRPPSSSVYSLAWSPNQELLALGIQGKDIELWHLIPGAKPDTLPNSNLGSNQVLSVAWSPDGQFLAAGNSDGTIKIWDTKDWTPKATIRVGQAVQTIAWAPDSIHLASGDFNGSLQIWDGMTGQATSIALLSHAGPIKSLAWAPDSKWLASAGEDSVTRIWGIR